MKQELERQESATGTPDYFAVFDLPRKLNVDLAALEREFYLRSRKLHPDRFANGSSEQQEWATEQTSMLNDAYRTLRDGVLRTEHLLELEGVHMEEQSRMGSDAARASGTQKKQAVPPELLEEVFELNMQLQEMKMAHEMGEDPDGDTKLGLEAARANFTSKLGEIDEELRGLWSKWDESASAAVRDAMVDVLNRRGYVRNLVRDVNET
ncbi:MAG: co-chaperone HscB [Acidobacteriaceae bacterium]